MKITFKDHLDPNGDIHSFAMSPTALYGGDDMGGRVRISRDVGSVLWHNSERINLDTDIPPFLLVTLSTSDVILNTPLEQE